MLSKVFSDVTEQITLLVIRLTEQITSPIVGILRIVLWLLLDIFVSFIGKLIFFFNLKFSIQFEEFGIFALKFIQFISFLDFYVSPFASLLGCFKTGLKHCLEFCFFYKPLLI